MSYTGVILFSSLTQDTISTINTRRLQQAFLSKNLKHIEIDGLDPESVPIRNKLFSISNLRGVYPQVFIKDETNDSYEFIGNWDKIESLLDCDTLDAKVIEDNNIETFSKVFSKLSKN